MSLVAGTRLGPYEIQSAIGAGGMGEVYKARDTRLDRTVAIKILPAELSADPDRRMRFEREARAVAALSHPHICTLHDIGTHEGTTYLVMEHLAGETLADRLAHGPVPLAQALDVGAQIADALDAAHKHGIIHRDLKPGNVMLTGGGPGRSGVTSAKLLDFGLAKLVRHGERPALASETHAATEAAPVTARGTILGTLQYMAPEQLEGKEADPRTDLWALGAILYEMVTGRRAFEGESQVSLIGNIMNAEPASLAQFQPLTPPSLDRVVTKCLAKHPDGRWDSAHDVADELRWIAHVISAGTVPGAPAPRARGRRLAAVGAAALLGLVIGAAGMWSLRAPVPRPSPARVSLDVLPAEELSGGGVPSVFLPTPGGSGTALTWTPDGQALVFVGRRGGIQQLYMRRLDATEARPLPNTEGAQVPAVSRDGSSVAFWANGAISKVALSGGPAMELASGVALPPWGLVWDDRGRVLFGRAFEAIWAVPPEGPPAAVTAVAEAEVAHALPWPLPGGQTLLFTVRKRVWSWGDEEIVAQNLVTGERKVLLKDGADARYLPTGHLVFLRRGVLFAVPFDAAGVRVSGKETPVLDTVAQALTSGQEANITGAGQFAIAATGTLAWLPGSVVPYPDTTLVAVDRRGRVSPLSGPARPYIGPWVSPDGRQLAVGIQRLTEAGVWTYDLDRGTLRLLAGGGEATYVRWSPDGRSLVFDWLADGRRTLARQPVDGSASPQALVTGGRFNPSSFTPDGRQVAIVKEPDWDILSLTLDGGHARLQPLIQTPHSEGWPEFSPDGRWLAYGSNVSGRFEVYVRPSSGPGPSEQVSLDGGSAPAWGRAGQELFFVGLEDARGRNRMMAVDFSPGSPPGIGRPRALFEFDARLLPSCAPVRCFDVAPDGQRFYGAQYHTLLPATPVTHINLILNWFEELKTKLPASGVK